MTQPSTSKHESTRAERVRNASRARREAQRAGLRHAILDAAATLFVEEGYENFSMRRVAERIGYSATTLYRHFKDKDDLLFAIFDQGFEEFGRSLVEAAASTVDPVERIAAIGRAYVRFGKTHPGYYQMMFMERGDYLTKAIAEAGSTKGDSFGVLQRAVEAAIDSGAISPGDSRAYSNMLWAIVHGIVALGITMPNFHAFDSEEATDNAIRLALVGVLKR